MLGCQWYCVNAAARLCAFGFQGEGRPEHMVGVDLADGLPKIELECCMWSVTQLRVLVITNASCLHNPVKSIKPHAAVVMIMQQK